MDRKTAKSLNLNKYTGKACSQHPELHGERYVSGSRCVQCWKNRTKNKYEENKEEFLAQCKSYREKNKERLYFQKKEYRFKNKERLKEQKAEYYQKTKHIRNEERKAKRKSDPLFALSDSVRKLIGKAFLRSGFTKKSKTGDILGCDWETLKAHIESQFLEGMTWENRDKWHIDHIDPCCSAADKEEMLKLNHHINLRPLWAKDNLEKSVEDRKKAFRTSLPCTRTTKVELI